MLFWQRREVWLGDFEGSVGARGALEEAGIRYEVKLVRRDRQLVPGSTGRTTAGGLGQGPQNPGMYYLYVKRADAQRARALLGTEEIR